VNFRFLGFLMQAIAIFLFFWVGPAFGSAAFYYYFVTKKLCKRDILVLNRYICTR